MTIVPNDTTDARALASSSLLRTRNDVSNTKAARWFMLATGFTCRPGT